MVLVPLRFVEEGNIVQVQNQQVLGETIEVAVPTPVINNDAKLEEPYNQIDGPTVVR